MIQKDHFNKIQKRIKQHKRSLLKKRLRPMAEKGRGYAISPLKVNFAKVYLLRVLTTLRVVKTSKRPLHGAPGHSPLLVCTKIHPVKNFRIAKIFSSLPHFCQQNFFRFQRKKSAKRSAPSTPESVQSRSVDTDRRVRWQKNLELQS